MQKTQKEKAIKKLQAELKEEKKAEITRFVNYKCSNSGFTSDCNM